MKVESFPPKPRAGINKQIPLVSKFNLLAHFGSLLSGVSLVSMVSGKQIFAFLWSDLK